MQTVFDWLVDDFYVFGARFQNWMPLFVAIFAILIFISWRRGGNSRK